MGNIKVRGKGAKRENWFYGEVVDTWNGKRIKCEDGKLRRPDWSSVSEFTGVSINGHDVYVGDIIILGDDYDNAAYVVVNDDNGSVVIDMQARIICKVAEIDKVLPGPRSWADFYEDPWLIEGLEIAEKIIINKA